MCPQNTVAVLSDVSALKSWAGRQLKVLMYENNPELMWARKGTQLMCTGRDEEMGWDVELGLTFSTGASRVQHLCPWRWLLGTKPPQ